MHFLHLNYLLNKQRSICPHDPETNNPEAKQRLLCKEASQLQNDASKHANNPEI
jgi:hypothetical protein